MYCAEFWEQLAHKRFVFHNSLSAVSAVHADGSLYDRKLAPPASVELQHVFLAAFKHHIEHLNALGVSNACWSLSKLQIPGWDHL